MRQEDIHIQLLTVYLLEVVLFPVDRLFKVSSHGNMPHPPWLYPAPVPGWKQGKASEEEGA